MYIIPNCPSIIQIVKNRFEYFAYIFDGNEDKKSLFFVAKGGSFLNLGKLFHYTPWIFTMYKNSGEILQSYVFWQDVTGLKVVRKG